MKVVIQRCSKGSVYVNNKLISSIDKGFVLLVGIAKDDTLEDVKYLANKILKLRIFNDEKGIMNKSIVDINGEILSISQFTLQTKTKEGNRPSYANAASFDQAKDLYNKFNFILNSKIKTTEGVFGSDMLVNINNDGPVTIIIDSKDK